MVTFASIGAMSKVEYCNCSRGYIEEISIDRLQFKESLYGFTRKVIFRVDNAWRCEPVLETGTFTPCCSSTTQLTDACADFIRKAVIPGDIVENLTDACNKTCTPALWDVTGITSRTVLCVRLNTGAPCGDDDWDTDDGYVVRRRNAERVFRPNLTKVRVTNRCTCIVVFEGTVQDIDPEGDQARYLCVTAEGFDIQLRDAIPVTDTCCAMRSVIIKNIFDDTTCENQLMFPLVSGDERSPGIEHSPNSRETAPDFGSSQRGALNHLLDFASAEFWTRTDIVNQRAPACITHNTLDCPAVWIELSSGTCCSMAEGNLATRFETDCQFCVATIELLLRRVCCVCSLFAGSIYVRIEPEELTTVTVCGVNAPVPSGYLVSPWAESNLINLTQVVCSCTCPLGAFQLFTFDAPVSLAPCTGYWIVLSYQENNNNFATGSRAIEWSRDTAAAAACDLSTATFSCSTELWSAVPQDSFNFIVNRFSEAVWFYDRSALTWECYTVCIEADDASSMGLMTNKASCGQSADRLYLGFAGPIRGLNFCYCTESCAEYGTWEARYFGGHHAKIYGTVTADDCGTCCHALIDSTKDFRRVGIKTGDIVMNISDNSVGIITAVGADPCGNRCKSTLTVQDLFTNELSTICPPGSSKDFQIGDEYAVLGWQKIARGIHTTCACCTVLTDNVCGTPATFAECGVRVGDLVVNVNKDLVSFITAYTCTTITVGCGTMDWEPCDQYEVFSRWRSINIREFSNTFIAPPATLNNVQMAWTIPSDWDTLRFTGNTAVDLGPETTASGLACACHQRYWMVLQNTSIPTTEAQIDLMTALPGAGFGIKVSNRTRPTVICACPCAVSNLASCTTLRDISRNFTGLCCAGVTCTVGVLIGDIIDNESACPTSGVVTAITSSGAACSEANDQLVVCTPFACGDNYRIRRDQYPVEYFRLGTRPWKGATRYGMMLRDGTATSCQMASIRDAKVSKSSRAASNRVKVTGKELVLNCMCVNEYFIRTSVVEDKRAQREFKRTVQKSIVDLAVTSCQEATDRGEAELSRFVDAQDRICARLYGWPTSSKVIVRKSWVQGGFDSADQGARMDALVCGCFTVDATSTTQLEDNSLNFLKWDVRPGDLAINIDACCAEFVITGIVTSCGGNKNDALTGSFVCSADTWTVGDRYKVLQRRMLEVGCLVRVRIADCVCTKRKDVDECYLVTNICYVEPTLAFNVRLQRNFSSSAVGDFRDDVDITGYISDQVKRVGQLAQSLTNFG
jgi:hypothetical protein